MTECVNQHFVPRFYFKNFSEDSSRIHLLHMANDRIIFNAPIKGQCARRKFYGPPEIEGSLSQLDAGYSRPIKDAIYADRIRVIPVGTTNRSSI